MNIIFVCTGNTCRSPMAEGIFKNLLKDTDNINVASRGIAACEGEFASENSIKATSELGVDISKHRAHMLTLDDIKKSDYIFTMTQSHATAIKNSLPQYSDKVFSIKEFAECDDISDPYGGDIDLYRKCSFQISDSVTKIYHKLLGEVL